MEDPHIDYKPIALQLAGIGFSFPGRRSLFTDVTFDLQSNTTYALVGSNGVGKTTLFNLISGFHKARSGSIFFQGNRITGLRPFQINRKGVGRTFQDLRLVGRLSVRENVLIAMPNNATDHWTKALLPQSLFGSSQRHMESQVDKVIAEHFLWDIQDSFPREISFGQQKLLTLACCVANGAELLLLDEPVAGISALYKDRIALLLSRLKSKGKTILMIEHDLDFVERMADEFLLLSEGRLHRFDNLKTLTESDVAVRTYG